MLEELRITGLGVIAEATLTLAPGLTVLTGETGAGKTMVVTGLELLLGGRGDPSLVRAGVDRAAVEGRFLVDPEGSAARRAVDAGALLDDRELLLGRNVLAEGRSRAHLGGRSVPVSLLGELADDLVARHGQAAHLRLGRPAAQREALDRFAGELVAAPLAGYRAAYTRHRATGAELAELTTRTRERLQEADLLRHGRAEIAAVRPEPGEDGRVAELVTRLAHADALRRAADAAHTALTGGEESGEERDALGLVAEGRRALDAVAGHDPALAGLAGRLADAGYALADLAADLASYAASIDADPAALAAGQERQAALAALNRKYGPDVDAVLAWAAEAESRLSELGGDDDRIGQLQADLDELERVLSSTSGELSAARRVAADRLAEAVTAEIVELAMPHARLEVSVRTGPSFGPAGSDHVEFSLATHPGAPQRPIARGASGGELSRLMLALEVVLAGTDPVPTFVFDEVDAGVGGRAAVEIGARLARLAAGRQVLVVTHLPQVAAFADRHYLVEKNDDGLVTESGVRQVDGPDRIRELSRMLAGLADSELGRGHAEELLATAAAAKGS
ncbi:MAG TPA: DNA repair protein RecN [Mycobacteriales bacterium]|nr:DNA repair protein RecN [Mycobacteriales bacterium]